MQVAAPAGAADLPPARTRLLRVREHRVDRGVLRDVRVDPLLGLEGVAEHRPQPVGVAGLQGVAHRVGHLRELLHPEEGVLAPGPVQGDLRVDQPRVAPHVPRVAQQEVGAQACEDRVVDADRGRRRPPRRRTRSG